MEDKRYRTLHDIVKAARANLDETYWDYLIGGSDTETTVRRNRHAIDSLALVPKVLNDVSSIDTSGSILGQALSTPVMLAPLGSMQVFEAGGGASAARAAADSGVLSIASSVCEPGLEEIAAASDAPKIYQLYVRGDDDWLDGIAERVITSGYAALCLTVDTAVVSRRERDISKNVVPTSQASPGNFTYQASLNWATVARLKRDFDIPLVLKGISRVDDALKAVDHGVDLVYVSNHGGRQLDQGIASLRALPPIVEAINGQVEIAVDGGFYRGTDILKAIALGADAVGLGRLEGWAMAAGGVPALNRCLTLLKREVAMAMGLCGVASMAELDPSFVVETDNVTESDVFSAFPLMLEGY
jgi:glycolate oxidase